LGPVIDPDWYLYHLQRALWDPVDPRQTGSLRPELQFRVNGEVYRFSSERNLHRFMLNPTQWCGKVRDPVSGNKFLPTARSPEAYWIGGPYFFESDSTKARFVDDPHRYEIIRRM
jgi:YHS domain-containing protein